MITTYVDRLVTRIPGLHELGMSLSLALHRVILNGGEATKNIADLLHGTWLGHPLHPVLTDLPIGAWSLAILFDGIAENDDNEFAERTADTLTTIGVVAAIPTAITGLTDYSGVHEKATATATLHGLLNTTALLLYLLSLRDRSNGHRGRGVFYSTTAYLILLGAAYLGGHLVFNQKVGVDHAGSPSKPDEWTPVLDEAELAENEATRVEVEGNPIMLYRYGGTVYALHAVCSHAGGPLEKGKFDGFCVQCPWHDSVFDVRDGSIVHGPTTFPQPKYHARIADGRIEVRVEDSNRN